MKDVIDNLELQILKLYTQLRQTRDRTTRHKIMKAINLLADTIELAEKVDLLCKERDEYL